MKVSNVNLSNQSFKGVYVIKGSNDKVEGFKDDLRDSVVLNQMLDVKLSNNSKASIVATNDSFIPKGSSHIDTKDFDRSSHKSFLRDICTKIFGNQEPVAYLNLSNPDNSIDTINLNNGLKYTEDKQVLIDGSVVKTGYSGTIQKRELKDGTTVEYFFNYNNDDNDSRIKRIVDKDGVVLKEYYDDGNVKTEIDSDGIRKNYAFYDIGSFTGYYLESRILPDGTEYSYNEMGDVLAIKNPDGTSIKNIYNYYYQENCVPLLTIHSDGTVTSEFGSVDYDRRILSVPQKDGDIIEYDFEGNYKDTISPDHRFDDVDDFE